MIRPTKPEDTTALISLAEATGLFEPEQLEELNEMLTAYFNGNSGSDRFWLTDNDGNDGPVGVAYCEPERMTDRTWNLQLIAIHPDRQGQGRGGNLLRHVEQTLMTHGGRLLLVETSATLEQAQAFYHKYGYEREACIRDFYATGYDKVVFRKVLSAASETN